jgi:sterol desaturase/sphingolipid hydroxylase (fatty acid hydroxylase superfamily)
VGELEAKSSFACEQRWTLVEQFSMVLLGTVVARLIIPSGLVVMAIFAQNNHIGLCNHVSASLWLSIPISVLLFDCFIYWQH